MTAFTKSIPDNDSTHIVKKLLFNNANGIVIEKGKE